MNGSIYVYKNCPVANIKKFIANRINTNEKEIALSYRSDDINDDLLYQTYIEDHSTINYYFSHNNNNDDDSLKIEDFGRVLDIKEYKEMKDPELYNIITCESKYYDILFNIFDKTDDINIIERLWDILLELPTIPDYFFQIYKILFLENNGQIDWNKVYSKSNNILLYQLQILDSLIFPQVESENIKSWRYSFYEKNGVLGLLNVFLNQNEWVSIDNQYQEELSNILSNV